MHYQLHDYEIDSVTFAGNQIIFSFPNGFYVADQQGNEVTPQRKKLIFIIDRDYCENWPVESCVYIRQKKRFGWKDIPVKQFLALFKKGNMIIHDEYDSKLSNWKMLQMHAKAKWSSIEMFVTDVEEVLCQE